MAKERSTIRQRKAGGAQEQLAAAAAAAAEPKQTELTQWQKANFYAAQHIGLVLCAIGTLSSSTQWPLPNVCCKQ